MPTPIKNPTFLLTEQVNQLTKEISKLKDQDFMQVFKHPWKFIWYSFLKGLMIGFGSVLGASVLVAIFIYLLTQIRLVPVLGDFVQDVIDEIQIEQQEKAPVNSSTLDNTQPTNAQNSQTNTPATQPNQPAQPNP